MSSLNSPEGQYLALAGSFQKSQKTLANNFKTWGLKPSSKTQAPTILAATEVAYTSSVKQVEDARNRQILILNEDWVDECCEQKSWIAPEDKHIWEKGGTKESLAETGSTASGEPAGKPTENDSAKAPNPPPNPPENPPPQPPNPPENPPPQPPNPPENPPPQPPNPPENPPKHESDNESMEVALLKKQIEDLKNSKTNSKDGPSDRYDQSEDQKECFEIFYEWSRRFDDTDDPNTNRFEVDCHPADINKPLSDRRKEYEMEIMLITQFRSYVFVIDPEGKIEGYDCLRPGYLIPRSDCPAAARKYEDNGGEIVRAKQKENLQGKQMTDFVWWSVATDPEGRFCYCLGVFKGDKRPSL
ncbi:brct domain containing protein [Metarhizium album ARSEF 1941]|uniref:Brct domain containing protein n=1 Tax=Metarhizium album (strain ARSEF 1941) TaxID=1081103 RepID=A0A0B2X2K5_METAS|nr:brct domain containing protein [Metarhizium album ARSEF 1941]KHO00519.1 brct domain containing protein [Metarhizium album ARSEF 1941]